VAKGAQDCDRASYGLYSSSNGGMAFYISGAAGASSNWYRSPEAPASVWDGKWHHAAGTYDGSTVRLFIDGVEVGRGTPANTPIAYNPPAGAGLIGDYHGTAPVADIWRFLKALFSTSR
jgi:Concanavalin A-like lectin/glucanases superfamily